MTKEEFLSNVSDRIIERYINPESITLEEYESSRMNSYERKVLLRKLDIAALEKCINTYLNNSRLRILHEYELASNYDESLIGDIIPELLRRIKILGESHE